MAVPFDTAVSTIHSMFNGNVDREVVTTVLEANNGHMERTIECLLRMSGELAPEETSPSENNDELQNQIREDALYAKMLQDELFIQQLRTNPEFSEIFGVNSVRSSATSDRTQDVDFQIGEKIKQMGEAAKLKLRELALKFKKTDKPDVKYAPVSTTTDEDAEVVAFDGSLARRTATSLEDDADENEVPLTSKRNPLSTSTENKVSTGTKKHGKDD